MSCFKRFRTLIFFFKSLHANRLTSLDWSEAKKKHGVNFILRKKKKSSWENCEWERVSKLVKSTRKCFFYWLNSFFEWRRKLVPSLKSGLLFRNFDSKNSNKIIFFEKFWYKLNNARRKWQNFRQIS